MLILDANHNYELDGKPLPGVTSIITRFFPVWQAGDWYLKRGEMLHKALALMAEDDLDEASLSPEIAGQVAAAKKFRRETGALSLIHEQAYGHPIMRFAGTLDDVSEIDRKYWLIDWKSSFSPQAGPQLAAYAMLLRHHRPTLKLAGAKCVWLRNDGTYRVRDYTTSESEQRLNLKIQEAAFTGMLSSYNWAALNGLNDTAMPAEPEPEPSGFEVDDI